MKPDLNGPDAESSKPAAIESEAQYEAIMGRIEMIFFAERSTAEGHELERLLFLVEAYEKQHYPIDPPLTPPHTSPPHPSPR